MAELTTLKTEKMVKNTMKNVINKSIYTEIIWIAEYTVTGYRTLTPLKLLSNSFPVSIKTNSITFMKNGKEKIYFVLV